MARFPARQTLPETVSSLAACSSSSKEWIACSSQIVILGQEIGQLLQVEIKISLSPR